MLPPRASTTRVRRSHKERTCLSDPEAAMRLSSTATAVAPSRGGQTLPLTTAKVAFLSPAMAAFVAHTARQCRVMAKLDTKSQTDVARASTLPSSSYLDPTILEREKERIFYRTWQLVAHMSELARPGDFKPVSIIDEPILLTHAQDGKLRGFYNVCRHRAAQVVTTRGNRKSLQCGYHGWVSGLNARCRSRARWRAPKTST